MKVSELAKEYGTTNKAILEKLKSLKLKAKDGNQELNKAVLSVVKSALGKPAKGAVKAKEPAKPQKEKKAGSKKTAKKTGTKTVVKKEPVKKRVVKKKVPAKPKSAEPAVKKKVKVKDSAEPFIPLKPLAKKKRKPLHRDKEESKHSSKTVETDRSSQKAGTADKAGLMQAAVSKDTSLLAPVVDEADLIPLEVKVPIAVKDFALKIDQKTGVILKKLMEKGIFAHINQNLGEDIVRDLARGFGYNLTKVKTQEEQVIEGHLKEDESPELLTPRAPVITFMGHVDHGKTTLLDKIRKSRIADREHGGITQHIGAYSVKLKKGRITFLDTPGHEAFTSMRARGAHITDIIVLVVAADEGIMPQTEEAIDHARAADVPIVVAITKIDRKNADIDKVKQQLIEKDLKSEDWGGKTVVVGVSGITGEGIDQLLELILLEAELLELKANVNKKASGIVVEAHLSRGRGTVASLIVQSGTLKTNDTIVVGPYYGKIKAMFDDLERPIDDAGPSAPIEILGLPGVPEAGEMFYVVDDEKQAREITLVRQQKLKDEKLYSKQRITLEDLYSQIQQGNIKELNVILKADVQGSVEALKDSLEKIPSDEVKVKFIHSGVGDVNASDVILAIASNAIIIAFHVGIGPRANEELEKQPVDVRQYRIIYDAVNDMRKALEGLLDPKKKRRFLSKIEVRQVFKLSKSGMVAGCYVQKGKVTRKATVDVVRNGEVVYTGKISNLKRFKDDVKEVNEGFECGISVEGYDKIQAGDVLEAFEVETIARTL